MQATYSSEKLITLLDSTLNPSLRKQAEDELSLVKIKKLLKFKNLKIINFIIIKDSQFAKFQY